MSKIIVVLLAFALTTVLFGVALQVELDKTDLVRLRGLVALVESPPEPELFDYQVYMELASLISTSPAWTDQQPSAGEWKTAIRIARTFQTMKTDDVEKVLLVYASLISSGVFVGPSPANDDEMEDILRAQSKLLLILRLMFDTDAPTVNQKVIEDLEKQHFLIAGGFGSTATVSEMLDRRFAFPITWEEEHGPAVSHFHRQRGSTGLSPEEVYQPHQELRFFSKVFAIRGNLDRFLDEKISSWRDVITPLR